MSVKTVRINDLPAVATPITELPGGLFEVEVLTGPMAGAYVNKQLTFEQLVQAIGAGTLGRTRTLAQAQALIGTGRVERNVLYTVQDTAWTDTATGATGAVIYVQGLTPSAYASTGWTEGLAGIEAVPVDVAAGTYTTGATGGGVTQADLDAVATTLPTSASVFSAYTLAATDAGSVVEAGGSGSYAITIPDHATVALPLYATLEISLEGTATITVAGAAGVSVTGTVTSAGQFTSLFLRQRALDDWRVTGGV